MIYPSVALGLIKRNAPSNNERDKRKDIMVAGSVIPPLPMIGEQTQGTLVPDMKNGVNPGIGVMRKFVGRKSLFSHAKKFICMGH